MGLKSQRGLCKRPLLLTRTGALKAQGATVLSLQGCSRSRSWPSCSPSDHRHKERNVTHLLLLIQNPETGQITSPPLTFLSCTSGSLYRPHGVVMMPGCKCFPVSQIRRQRMDAGHLGSESGGPALQLCLIISWSSDLCSPQ